MAAASVGVQYVPTGRQLIKISSHLYRAGCVESATTHRPSEIDNSGKGESGAVGYPLFSSNPAIGPDPDGSSANGWMLPANSQIQLADMVDSPFINWPKSSVRQLSVGNQNGNELYDTYLMYKPDNGAWVPLAKIHWEWAKGMTQDALGAVNETPAVNPIGNMEQYPYWPSWTGTATAVYATPNSRNGWVQQ
jgi:hypothetical protein